MKELNRETLAEQVADTIVELIENENLAPGDSLPSTATLEKIFQVSRPVIREALKTLEGRDILEISNGRTPTIKPITSDSLKNFFTRAIAIDKQSLIELLEVRRGLEIQSALLSARYIKDEELVELKEILEQMRQNLSNIDQFTVLDVKFHLKIASTTRNSMLYFLIESIRDALTNTIKEGLRSRYSHEQLLRVQDRHDMIFAQLSARNEAGVAEAMASHFDDAINAIVYNSASHKSSS
jgi:DNA-binding FadR family transcriptional regulator